MCLGCASRGERPDQAFVGSGDGEDAGGLGLVVSLAGPVAVVGAGRALGVWDHMVDLGGLAVAPGDGALAVADQDRGAKLACKEAAEAGDVEDAAVGVGDGPMEDGAGVHGHFADDLGGEQDPLVEGGAGGVVESGQSADRDGDDGFGADE